MGATVLTRDANVNEDAERPERERSGIAQGSEAFLGDDNGTTTEAPNRRTKRLPFVLPDSLEAVDAERIATLVEYFSEHAEYLLVTLYPRTVNHSMATMSGSRRFETASLSTLQSRACSAVF